MKFNFFGLLHLSIIAGFATNAQSVYNFQYKYPVLSDTTTYNTFFRLEDNGKGFARVSFTPVAGKSRVLFEMQFREEYPMDKNGIMDTAWLVCKTSVPVLKDGDRKRKLPFPVSFWLKMNSEKGIYEPWGVTLPDADKAPEENNLMSFSNVTDPLWLRDAVKSFFTPNEAFYKNLFDPRKRGELLTDEEKKTKIYLLIIANTVDSGVGASSMMDLRRAIKTFDAVAKSLSIENNLIVDTVYGENFNRTNVLNAIKKINPQRGRDIVIFYYSGHGFTNPQQPGKKYPFLDLLYPFQKPRPEPKDSTLNIEDIYTMIKEKGARFNLVISDCCNTRIEEKTILKEPPPGQRGGVDMSNWNKANIKNLFMVTKPLSILATAASKGERAAGNIRYGGFFSNNFFSSLTSYFNNDKISPLWIQILADAQKQTIWQADHTYCPEEKKICHQTPPPPKVN